MRIIVQVTALLATLELQESARRKGHFALYNCLVLGHTKYSGVPLYSASAATDTGSKSFDCALVSTLESCDDPDNGNYINYDNYMYYTP